MPRASSLAAFAPTSETFCRGVPPFAIASLMSASLQPSGQNVDGFDFVIGSFFGPKPFFVRTPST